jgi:galactose-1-phosphate uridylyltransferase
MITCPLCAPDLSLKLIESNHFSVISGIAPKEYIIFPKEHITTLADIPEHWLEEFRRLKELIHRMIRADRGSSALYEHAGRDGWDPHLDHRDDHDHAHMHCAPSLAGRGVQHIVTPESMVLSSWRDLWSLRRESLAGLPYFYLEDETGRRLVLSHEKIHEGM